MKVEGREGGERVTEKYSGTSLVKNGTLSSLKKCFKTIIYFVDILSPGKEFLDTGIHNAIKIFRIAGIPRFYGRNFTLCRLLILT
jgi:hypothetical protein